MKIPTSGGIIVIVVTTIAGVLIALATSTELKSGLESFKQGSTVPGTFIVLSFWGGAIGATVGSLLWCLIINIVCRNNNAEELSPMPSSIMSPIEKTLIVVLGGMILMVFTTVYGAATGLYLTIDDLGDYALNMYIYTIVGGVVGAVVGSLLWGLLGYMVCRNKKAAINGVAPDDSTPFERH